MNVTCLEFHTQNILMTKEVLKGYNCLSSATCTYNHTATTGSHSGLVDL